MDLTTAQLQTIKTDIANNGDLNAFPNTPDGNQSIADLYNLTFSPTFTVWKTMVKIGEIGNAFDSAELGGLTTANQSRLQTISILWLMIHYLPMDGLLNQKMNNIGVSAVISPGI